MARFIFFGSVKEGAMIWLVFFKLLGPSVGSSIIVSPNHVMSVLNDKKNQRKKISLYVLRSVKSNNDDSTDDSNTTMMNCRDNQKSCKSTNGSKPTQYHAQGTFPSSPETLLC
ncbi:hypothetical protein PS15m_000958 [Mucor circinelloides]